jgi:hypothetical protein
MRPTNKKGPPFGEPFSILRMVAPGVEFIFNYLPAMVFMKVNIRFYL